MRVGPYKFGTQLGSGAMGTVWRALAPSGERVAVKVVAAHADDPDVEGSVRREVEAMASLSHPCVAAVLDFGLVTEAERLDSNDALRAGSPWYAMELLPASLDNQRPASWAVVQRILLDILDGLAHAHARGIVHRDLKPANVLVEQLNGVVGLAPLERDRRVVALADFGIAHALTSREIRTTAKIAARVAGTPGYMAPEQVRGDWRSFGPWTDLYALGCVAWRILCGETPYGRRPNNELFRAHLVEPLPGFEPTMEVPAPLETWLRGLLQKDPANRYQRAADAARDLLSLSTEHMAPRVVRHAPPAVEVATVRTTQTTNEWRGFTLTGAVTPIPAMNTAPGASFEVAPDWRQADVGVRTVGVGLVALREAPLVGREPERDSAWAALREIVASRAPGAIVVEGPAGVGRSRFAEWLARRADELGCVEVLRASTQLAGLESLSSSVLRWLRCDGLDLERALHQTEARLQSVVGAVESDEVVALTALAQTGQRRPSRGTRLRTVAHLLERIAEVRPTLLLLDDVRPDSDEAALVEMVSSSAEGPIVLVVATSPEAAPHVVERARDSVHRVVLAPLSLAETSELVHGVAPVSEALANRVAVLADGLPGHAIQIVTELVHRGQLDATEPAALTLGAIWTDAVRSVVGDDRRCGRALDAAAALGETVVAAEWADVCGRLGVLIPADLVDRLVTRRLAARTLDGWRFVVASVRRAILDGMADRGAVHAACAAALRALASADPSERTATRIGEHALEAGEIDDGSEWLVRAATQLTRTGDFRSAGHLLARAERATGGRPDTDPIRLRVLVDQLRLEQRGDPAAIERITRLADAARSTGDDATVARALTCLARMLSRARRLEDGERVARAALDAARASGLDTLVAQAGRYLAEQLRSTGKLQEAILVLLRCHEMLRSSDDAESRAWTEVSLAILLTDLGELERAAEHASAARAAFESERVLHGALISRLVLGDVARYGEDLEGADRHYTQAWRLLRLAGGPGHRELVATSRAICALERHAFELAIELAEDGLANVSSPLVRNMLRLLRVCAKGAAGDVEVFDSEIAAVIEADRDGGFFVDYARAAESAGRHLFARGDEARGARLLVIARRHWRGLGRTARVTAIEALLSH